MGVRRGVILPVHRRRRQAAAATCAAGGFDLKPSPAARGSRDGDCAQIVGQLRCASSSARSPRRPRRLLRARLGGVDASAMTHACRPANVVTRKLFNELTRLPSRRRRRRVRRRRLVLRPHRHGLACGRARRARRARLPMLNVARGGSERARAQPERAHASSPRGAGAAIRLLVVHRRQRRRPLAALCVPAPRRRPRAPALIRAGVLARLERLLSSFSFVGLTSRCTRATRARCSRTRARPPQNPAVDDADLGGDPLARACPYFCAAVRRCVHLGDARRF